MASSVQRLVSTVLGTSAVTLYTSPTGTWTQITKLLLVNTSGSTQTATLAIVAAATSYTTTNAQGLLPSQSWNSPNEYGLVLNPGDGLSAFASAGSAITFILAGLLLQ
jgi:hypothetical protein